MELYNRFTPSPLYTQGMAVRLGWELKTTIRHIQIVGWETCNEEIASVIC